MNLIYDYDAVENFVKNSVANTPYFSLSEKQISLFEDYIVKNWDNIDEKIKNYKIKKEQGELEERKRINRYYRNLVKHVNWSGNTCVVYWSDGTQTKARWDSFEDFDPEKAILVCIARKFFGNTGIYNEVLQKYADDGWEHYDKEFFKDEWVI